MILRLKFLLTALAVGALSAALLVPIAGASGTGTMMGGGTTGMTGTTQPSTGTMMGGGTGGTTGTTGTTQPATGTMMGGGTGGATTGTQPATGTMMGGGTGGATTGTQPATGTMMGGVWDGTGSWGGTGMWGLGSGMIWLADNPAAMQAWLQVRAEHVKAMQTWQGTYKADLTAPEAQQALHDLWTANWSDMRSFYEQYADGADWTAPASGMWNGWRMDSIMGDGSWDASHMWGSDYGASWMMNHPAGMGLWLALRSRQMSAMNAWWQQHSAAPGSPSAQAALKTLNAQKRTQVRHFYRQHHLSTSSGMMRTATGGWMGLGGMWGGFGW